jgi:hypothetical protein
MAFPPGTGLQVAKDVCLCGFELRVRECSSIAQIREPGELRERVKHRRLGRLLPSCVDLLSPPAVGRAHRSNLQFVVVHERRRASDGSSEFMDFLRGIRVAGHEVVPRGILDDEQQLPRVVESDSSVTKNENTAWNEQGSKTLGSEIPTPGSGDRTRGFDARHSARRDPIGLSIRIDKLVAVDGDRTKLREQGGGGRKTLSNPLVLTVLSQQLLIAA